MAADERLKSLLALATPSVALGALLLQQGIKQVGWIFVGLGGVIVGAAIFSYLIPGLARVLSWLSRPIRWITAKIFKLVRIVYVWNLKQLLNPVIREAFAGRRWNWVGQHPRLYPAVQRADFKVIDVPNGQRLRGLEFTVRPDYQFGYWRAGFRLGPKVEEITAAAITSTFLFHIWMDAWGQQPHMRAYLQDQNVGHVGLQHWGTRPPTFSVRANLWPVPNSHKVRISVTVDGHNAAPIETEFDEGLAERVFLLAWADGKEFKVYFDNVQLFFEKSR